jgi:two-component system NtrC family sensor kinase
VHKLLERQLKKHLGGVLPEGARMSALVAAVDAAYTANDADRALLERSIELASAELWQRNEELERDLEAIKRLELELRQAEKLRAVGQLAAGVAHEINTPIQYVGDCLHFMKTAYSGLARLGRQVKDQVATSGEDDVAMAALRATTDEIDLDYLLDELPKALEQTTHGVERVASIVSAMKDFGRQDSRDRTLADVNHCLKNTLLVVQGELKYVADVELHLGEVPAIPCYPGELGQVFLNLLVNAAHAIGARYGDSAERGLIRASTKEDRGHVVVEIADNGAGILPAHRSRIFEPFFTTKPVGKGTGQGLALARSIIVEKHGGSLTFESVPGQGTTFRVSLPMEELNSEPPLFAQLRAVEAAP